MLKKIRITIPSLYKILSLLTCFQFLSIIAKTQDSYLTLVGEVADIRTKTPLGYANITILGRSIGTTSNMNGGFEFHIPTQYSNDTLAISFIGYNTYKICLADLKSQALVSVRMQPSIYQLEEITIHDKPYTVYSLLEDVMKKYDSNYNTKPYEMEAFYRETRRENEKYGYLLEAAFHIYQKTYKLPYQSLLEEIRINRYDEAFDYKTNENFLKSLLMNDYIGEPNSGFYRHFKKTHKYIIEDTTFIDYEPVYVVSLGNVVDWKETWYINAKDFAIIKFVGEGNYGADGNLVMGKVSKDKVLRYRYLKVVNSYSLIGEKYYLKYMSMRLDHDVYDQQKKSSETYKIIEREVMVNRVNSVNMKPLVSSETMKSYSLEDQLKKYNAAFWDNYNVMVRTRLQEQIAKDLESRETLDEQFKKQQETVKKKKKN
ncbi:MAG: carboxypeptidase-like regulatory domain-containing protein [Chryseotalea sp. WA131a]|nr:MAG: carboxypeptidase-like regulatory domain-containing protein [Chryseotalea sp. WA131a]